MGRSDDKDAADESAEAPLFSGEGLLDTDVLRTIKRQGISRSCDVHMTIEGAGFMPTLAQSLSHLPAVNVESPEDLERRSTRSDFVVKSLLGRGGMAEVHLAEQRSLSREVAIKQLIERSSSAVGSLVREATITGQLEHPNIVPIHAFVNDPEMGPSVVMKRIAGRPWEEVIADGAPLERHIEIAMRVCDALSYAHDRGVIHRDIKPANVMVGKYGEVYLVDWGVARTKGDPPSTDIIGTPSYMSPEMIRGAAEMRSDIYLLGASMHHAITKEPRHPGSSLYPVIAAALESEPFDFGPEVPEDLAFIVNKACASDPMERFASPAELKDALRQCAEHRAALEIADAAQARLSQLEDLVAGDNREEQYAETQALFSETRFGFEMALQTFPDSPRIVAERERALQLMTEYEIEMEHPNAANALLDRLSDPPPSLREQVEALQKARRRDRETLEQVARDRDFSVGAKQRWSLYAGLGLLILAIAIVTAVIRARTSQALSVGRVTIIGALLFVATAGFALYQRKQEWNLVTKRLFQVLLGTLGTMELNRLLAYINGGSAEHVLVTDSFICVFGTLALAVYHRAGIYLSAASIVIAIVSGFRPDLADELFLILAALVPMTFVLTERAVTRSVK